MRRSIALALVAAFALAAWAPGAATAGDTGATATQKAKAKKKADAKRKAKAKKRAANCRNAKPKAKGKARKAGASQRGKANKRKAKAKKRAANCRKAKARGKGKKKEKKKPKAEQPTGGLSDGTYEDAANKVTISIMNGATQVTAKVSVTSPAFFLLSLSGALAPDGSASGSTQVAGVPVPWELQISGGTRYRLQYKFGDSEATVINGRLR